VEGPWLKNALANLGVLYEVTQTISHTLDLEQLLERIMDIIFRSLDADRGCVMLRGTDGADLEPKAVRWRDSGRRSEKVPVSRTVVDHVLREKQGILVSDAARDERFQAVQSVVRAGVREVICVPMRGRHETMGVLYLDTTTPHVKLAAGGQTGKFSEEHLKLAGAIAHQAALAVEETRYYQAMVNAERLAAVGQTVAALSHHIKNILHGLQWGGQMVEDGLRDDDGEMLRTGWRIVKTNQGKVQDLVKDMLSYSKDREPVLETVDLNEVVAEVVELVQGRAAGLGAELTTRLDQSLPKVQADREGIHRALLNIVSNALDAVDESEQPRLIVASSREQGGEWVRLQVRDNGPGIAPEKQAEIFRPFVSTKGARGTGLGLAVSRKILREHGGDIVVQSAPGQGSLFTLRLPHKGPFGFDPQSTHTEIPVAPPPD
jgi:signal transduction histidine kinase